MDAPHCTCDTPQMQAPLFLLGVILQYLICNTLWNRFLLINKTKGHIFQGMSAAHIFIMHNVSVNCKSCSPFTYNRFTTQQQNVHREHNNIRCKWWQKVTTINYTQKENICKYTCTSSFPYFEGFLCFQLVEQVYETSDCAKQNFAYDKSATIYLYRLFV